VLVINLEQDGDVTAIRERVERTDFHDRVRHSTWTPWL
jgi:hypothetical protein